jgi:hypothetical protein
VTFNVHEGSTKSYAFTREYEVELAEADFVPLRLEITVPASDTAVQAVQMHDGSAVDTPLAELPFETLCPGQTALQALMERYR